MGDYRLPSNFDGDCIQAKSTGWSFSKQDLESTAPCIMMTTTLSPDRMFQVLPAPVDKRSNKSISNDYAIGCAIRFLLSADNAYRKMHQSVKLILSRQAVAPIPYVAVQLRFGDRSMTEPD